MRVFVLFLLTLLLGMMIYLKLEMDEARNASNKVKAEFFTEEFTITQIDDSGYQGVSHNGKRIYFKKEKLESGEKVHIDDTVILYFEKSERVDGLVKVEKKN
jgi:hypothetical protein